MSSRLHIVVFSLLSALMCGCAALDPISYLQAGVNSAYEAKQTPESSGAGPAEYRGHSCEMLTQLLPAMTDGYRTSQGFQQTVYGWHVNSIRQVQQEKSCDGSAQIAASTPSKPRLGVALDQVSSSVAQSLSLTSAQGALVITVNPGSAAEKAGLKPMDVILEIAGQIVQTPADVKAIIDRMRPGYAAPLRVWRDKATLEVTIQLNTESTAV